MVLFPLLFVAIFFAHYLIMPLGFGGIDSQRMMLVAAIAVILARFALRYHFMSAILFSLFYAAIFVCIDLPYSFLLFNYDVANERVL